MRLLSKWGLFLAFWAWLTCGAAQAQAGKKLVLEVTVGPDGKIRVTEVAPPKSREPQVDEANRRLGQLQKELERKVREVREKPAFEKPAIGGWQIVKPGQIVEPPGNPTDLKLDRILKELHDLRHDVDAIKKKLHVQAQQKPAVREFELNPLEFQLKRGDRILIKPIQGKPPVELKPGVYQLELVPRQKEAPRSQNKPGTGVPPGARFPFPGAGAPPGGGFPGGGGQPGGGGFPFPGGNPMGSPKVAQQQQERIEQLQRTIELLRQEVDALKKRK